MFEDYGEHEREMLTSAYNVITSMEMWDFLKRYKVNPNKGFMFDNNDVIGRIMSNISRSYDNHSGSSMAYTMRVMEKIAAEQEEKSIERIFEKDLRLEDIEN
jgi:hypothetical protein